MGDNGEALHATLNPANKPLVDVLYAVAADVEASSMRIADGLRDIARTLQLVTAHKVDDATQGKIAHFVDEFADTLKRAAVAIEEA